jgi:hypothetical protein
MNRRKFLAFFSAVVGGSALSQSTGLPNSLQSWAKTLTPKPPLQARAWPHAIAHQPN